MKTKKRIGTVSVKCMSILYLYIDLLQKIPPCMNEKQFVEGRPRTGRARGLAGWEGTGIALSGPTNGSCLPSAYLSAALSVSHLLKTLKKIKIFK